MTAMSTLNCRMRSTAEEPMTAPSVGAPHQPAGNDNFDGRMPR